MRKEFEYKGYKVVMICTLFYETSAGFNDEKHILMTKIETDGIDYQVTIDASASVLKETVLEAEESVKRWIDRYIETLKDEGVLQSLGFS